MFKAVSRALARKQNGEKGFTLIELLVVVVIIGILAAIAIPIFLNQRQGAWRSSVESDVKNAATGVETALQNEDGSLGADIATGTAETTTFTIGPSGQTTKVVVTDGNTITIAKDAGGDPNDYMITGTNKNLTGTGTTYTYHSNTGKGTWA